MDKMKPTVEPTYDPILSGPIRLRISDGYRHAENFEAATIEEFRLNALEAINRFRAWKIDQYPTYQTRNRDRAKTLPQLYLHVRDTTYEMARTPLKPHWINAMTGRGTFPFVCVEALEQDGGATMWEATLYTLNKMEQFAKFFGYHPSGEDKLGDFLKEVL